MLDFSTIKKRKFWRRPGVAFKKLGRPHFASARRNNAGVFLRKIAPAAFVFFLIYLAFFSRLFLIENIEISGNNNVRPDDIKNVVNNEIFKPIFGFIPGNNFFLNLNRDENIKTVLLDKFPEIETIKIEKKLSNNIIIDVVEKRPELIWCRASDCYYIDDNGMALTLTNKVQKTNEKNRFIKIIEEPGGISDDVGNSETDSAILSNKIEKTKNAQKPDYNQENDDSAEKTPDRIKLGDVVSDKDFVSFAVETDKEIKKNTTLEIKYYKTGGTKTRELVAYTENDIKIFFDATNDTKSQVEYLRDFINRGVGEKDISKIKYIYLRADNKIFYK